MSDRYLIADAQSAMADVQNLVLAFPELQDDFALALDMIEGETAFLEVMDQLVTRLREKEALAAATKQRKAEIAERQARFEKQAEGFRALMLAMMRAADCDKLPMAEATVSVTKPRLRVVVDDVLQLPQGAFQTVRKPIAAKELQAQIEAARGDFPGAHLETGEPGLMVRAR